MTKATSMDETTNCANSGRARPVPDSCSAEGTPRPTAGVGMESWVGGSSGTRPAAMEAGRTDGEAAMRTGDLDIRVTGSRPPRKLRVYALRCICPREHDQEPRGQRLQPCREGCLEHRTARLELCPIRW